ncbi:uncharacterized protein LOC132280209 isoform X2 [Cornus florida]|uniref:uncharacterized protein LOC132280209 isoform X2 n=1 Tax=Cornus florida TaxID=4283 RepID=UPI00289E83AD|nr:uncharacterized protein LOC132280209 isoform X2 [Cornus florida]
MGALAPVSPWIPEDDLLLRNAVEAGASLESLAKGAVQFSRRFTVQELQNRWHSLLYDPVVSAEASARMIEFERSTSNLLSKTNRFEISKEKCVSGKRKAGSVRKCYYALRKRICNEPFESTNLSFLTAPGNGNCIGNGDELPPANVMLNDPISNHFGVQDSNFGIISHAFPHFAMNSAAGASDDATAHAFCTGYQDPVVDFPVDQISMHEQIPHNFEENYPLPGSCSGVEEFVQSKELQVCDIFEADDLEATPSAIYNQNNGNMCPGFGGNPVFNSPITDCDASYHNLGYSSPQAQMPIWSAFEGISAPTMPDVPLNENKQQEGNAFSFPDNHDAINTSTSGYDVHSDSKLEIQMQCDNMKNAKPSSDDYFTELSYNLLNSDGEELFMDDDGKDGIDKSYIDNLSSILLDSPNANDTTNMLETKASVAAPDDFFSISGGACSGESDESALSHYVDGHAVCSSEGHMLPSASAVHRQFPELCNGVICCTLNTEDMEIPCNDDVFLPIHMPSTSSMTELKFHEVNKPTSSLIRNLSANRNSNAGSQSLIKREGKNPEPSHLSSQMLGSHLLPEMGQNHSVGDLGVKFELPNSDCPHIAFKRPSTASEGPNQISLETACTNTLLPATVKGETMEIEQAKHLTYNSADSYLDKPVHAIVSAPLNSLVNYPQINVSCSKPEVEAPATLQNHQAFHAEMSSAEMNIPEPVVNISPSEQEELPSECDDGVPYFSDVEAMILDMDLSPDDQDLYSSREVSRYQHEDSKRAIIRLEQAAHSSMQRVIASRGAFAVLYGRHSKHYIKRPEVLIGRGTEDVNVDIDLGREGRANKISRRQAIIMMDKEGSFHLKNLGKCSIFVNNKEVAPKQCLALTSSCLLEIRGMPFIFETNQTCVKQYVDSISKESQTQSTKIEQL